MLNESLRLMLDPVVISLQSTISLVQWLVGGLFGLYLLSLIGKIIFSLRLQRRLKRIEESLHRLERRRLQYPSRDGGVTREWHR